MAANEVGNVSPAMPNASACSVLRRPALMGCLDRDISPSSAASRREISPRGRSRRARRKREPHPEPRAERRAGCTKRLRCRELWIEGVVRTAKIVEAENPEILVTPVEEVGDVGEKCPMRRRRIPDVEIQHRVPGNGPARIAIILVATRVLA